MRIRVHLDWLSYGFDLPKEIREEYSGVSAVVMHFEQMLGQAGKGMGGNRWYRHMMRWEDQGVLISWGPRIKANRDVAVQVTGCGFQTPEMESLHWEAMQFWGGIPNRIDVAWDFFGESLLDLRHVEEFKNLRPKFGKRVDMAVNGNWSGCTVGFGAGSEAGLRIYDKELEQGENVFQTRGEDDVFWWRVEMQLRGNTCKEQRWERKELSGVYDTFRGAMVSRYNINPDGGRVGVCQARKKGVATSAAAVLFWQRRQAKAERKLAVLNQAFNDGYEDERQDFRKGWTE